MSFKTCIYLKTEFNYLIHINNYYGGLFNLYFEFEISFLENFLKNEVEITKDFNQVTNFDALEDIYIWWMRYF